MTSLNNAAAELLAWYGAQGRDLPWRKTRDPYAILVSEVMLQQTQVDRVLAYHARWLERLPTAEACAAADLDTIHRLWKGLGYPSRADRLRATCAAVVAAGAWPTTAEELQELPGIGPYTAHAVACFAFHADVPVVDTNIARVYVRRDDLALPVSVKGVKGLWQHAAAQVPIGEAAPYHNALMDLGATVCTARIARCTVCPWQHRCASAGTADASTGNPLKVASAKVAYGDAKPPRGAARTHIVLALVHDGGRYLIARRPDHVHLGGAWELPGGKREAGEGDREAVAREVREELGGEVLAARHLMSWHHAYPDRYLTFHLYRVRLFDADAVRPLASQELRWVTPQEFLTVEFPAANRPIQDRLRRYHRLG